MVFPILDFLTLALGAIPFVDARHEHGRVRHLNHALIATEETGTGW